MKNLIHVPMEKLEDIPSRMSSRACLKNYEYSKYKGDSWRRYDNDDADRMDRYLRKIVFSSIGEKWDDVYSIISKKVRNLPYYIWSTKRGCYVDHVVIEDGKWFVDTGRGDLLTFDKFEGRYWKGNLYIHPITKRICTYKGSRDWLPKKDYLWYREHYAKRVKERQKRKKEKKYRYLLSILELSMINNPELHYYYRRLVTREKEINDSQAMKNISRSLYKSYFMTPRKERKLIRELDEVKVKITRLLNRDFSDYYATHKE